LSPKDPISYKQLWMSHSHRMFENLGMCDGMERGRVKYHFLNPWLYSQITNESQKEEL
jgi:hypothetical protein